MESDERRYRLTYSATITVEIDAQSSVDAQDYARADVINALCDENLVRREVWIPDINAVTVTVAVENVSPEAIEVPA